MGFGVWGLGLQGSGYGVEGLGLGVQGFGDFRHNGIRLLARVSGAVPFACRHCRQFLDGFNMCLLPGIWDWHENLPHIC